MKGGESLLSAALFGLFLLLAACHGPVTEWPEGPVIVPPAAALSQCADPDGWDAKWCANRRPQ
jgi:hypothetical protein